MLIYASLWIYSLQRSAHHNFPSFRFVHVVHFDNQNHQIGTYEIFNVLQARSYILAKHFIDISSCLWCIGSIMELVIKNNANFGFSNLELEKFGFAKFIYNANLVITLATKIPNQFEFNSGSVLLLSWISYLNMYVSLLVCLHTRSHKNKKHTKLIITITCKILNQFEIN